MTLQLGSCKGLLTRDDDVQAIHCLKQRWPCLARCLKDVVPTALAIWTLLYTRSLGVFVEYTVSPLFCCDVSCSSDAKIPDAHTFAPFIQAATEPVLPHLLSISNATTSKLQVHHLSTCTPVDHETVKTVTVIGVPPCCSCLLDMSHGHHSIEPLSQVVSRDAKSAEQAVTCGILLGRSKAYLKSARARTGPMTCWVIEALSACQIPRPSNAKALHNTSAHVNWQLGNSALCLSSISQQPSCRMCSCTRCEACVCNLSLC